MAAADVMRDYVAAVRRRDFDAAFARFDDDIVFRVPERGAAFAEHRGRAAAMRYIEAARELSHAAEVEVEVIDALTSETRFALIVDETFHRDGGVVTLRRANVYRVEGERIVEIWVYEGDAGAADVLFG
jgi:ketosteroid isomerase-like protein